MKISFSIFNLSYVLCARLFKYQPVKYWLVESELVWKLKFAKNFKFLLWVFDFLLWDLYKLSPPHPSLHFVCSGILAFIKLHYSSASELFLLLKYLFSTPLGYIINFYIFFIFQFKCIFLGKIFITHIDWISALRY